MRYLIFLIILLSSCELKVKTGKNEKEETAEKPTRNRSKIRNGIEIKTSGGLKVEQAFLTYEEDGSFVGEDNVTTINKPVKLTLIVKGWKEKDGGVMIDAEEKVTTSEDEPVLHQKDMLAELGIIPPKNAEYLNFKFVITRLNKLVDYFLVEAVARNKNFDQELKASFKMHVE